MADLISDFVYMVYIHHNGIFNHHIFSFDLVVLKIILSLSNGRYDSEQLQHKTI